MWSLGVTFHTMLTGNLPFDHSDDSQLANMICTEQLKFEGPDWQVLCEGWLPRQVGSSAAPQRELCSRLVIRG